MQKIHIKNATLVGNPLANALVVIAGAIIIGVSLVLGFFAFLALSATVLIVAAVIRIRTWWFGRKSTKKPQAKQGPDGEVIEGEFHVVKKDKNS